LSGETKETRVVRLCPGQAFDSLRTLSDDSQLQEASGPERVQAAANTVIFKRLRVGIEFPETFPQGLKPRSFQVVCGTTEVVPFQNTRSAMGSVAAEVVPFQNTKSAMGSVAAEVVPFQDINEPLCGGHHWSGFGNCVDANFIGIPPFPQKKAERMGHGSLQKKL
jgi:hypothetical protein